MSVASNAQESVKDANTFLIIISPYSVSSRVLYVERVSIDEVTTNLGAGRRRGGGVAGVTPWYAFGSSRLMHRGGGWWSWLAGDLLGGSRCPSEENRRAR